MNELIGKITPGAQITVQIQSTGPQGAKGDTGATGPSGPMGPQGPKGDSGESYVHPDSPGSKHIPAGGASGQLLGWSADGTALWQDAPEHLPLTGGDLSGQLTVLSPAIPGGGVRNIYVSVDGILPDAKDGDICIVSGVR